MFHELCLLGYILLEISKEPIVVEKVEFLYRLGRDWLTALFEFRKNTMQLKFPSHKKASKIFSFYRNHISENVAISVTSANPVLDCNGNYTYE